MPDHIATSARTLSERLRDPVTPLFPQDPDPPGGEGLLDRWRQSCARGDHADFRRRISVWTAQDPDLFVARLRTTSVSDPELPDWLAFLDSAAAWFGREPDVRVAPPEDLPGLTVPLVECAWQRLPASGAWLSDRAAQDLRSELRGRLAGLLQTSVDMEFRRAGQTWQSWLQLMTRGGAFPLWHRYPVLARLIGTAALNWVAATGEFLDRIHRDAGPLTELVGDRPVQIESVVSGLSDLHSGGRRVLVVAVRTAADQHVRVVYKPHDLSGERLLGQVLTWLKERGSESGAAPAVLTRSGYGWAQFAEHTPCADPATYYRRSGSLAAALFALGATDCHAENIVARGDEPVVVDAETILQPTLRTEDDSPPFDDVVDGMFLPRWLRIGGQAVDMSGLGGHPQPWRRRSLQWVAAGTDDAHLVPRSDPVDVPGAVVRTADGVIHHPADHLDDVVAGFTDAWGFLATHRQELIDGPLAGLAAARVRVLVRMTRTYARVAQTALVPPLLHDGLTRSVHLDHLARSFLDRTDWATSLALADGERDQLEVGDIPFFEVAGADDALVTDNGHLEFAESAEARALRRVTGLTQHGLERQLDQVQSALRLAPRRVRATCFAAARPVTDPTTGAEEGDIRAAVARLADQVLRQTGGGRPFGPVAVSVDQWGLESAPPGLYDGVTGIALGLAGAAAALDRSDARARATQLWANDLAAARHHPQRIWSTRGPGAQDGVGGMFVGWAALAALQPDGWSVARETVDLLLDAMPEAVGPGNADLLSGDLGLLAGLLAVTSAGWHGVPPPSLMDRVVRSVHAQLAQPGPSGFSHGDAGMIAVLHAAAGRGWGDPPVLRSLAEACLARESAAFDRSLGDWPDRRRDGRVPGPGWCNGAAGIALSRALVNDVGRDLDRASPRLGHDVLPRDTLCCGAAGRTEVLRFLRDRGLVADSAYAHAVGGLVQRTAQQELRLGVPADCRLQPLGLFQGISGVLLALAGSVNAGTPHVLALGTT